MTRQRKELLKKIYELEEERAVDRELACGYTPSDFGFPDPFDEELQVLREQLAATYGLTVQEYDAREYEIAEQLASVSDMPFGF